MATTHELSHTLHWSTVNVALFIAKEDSAVPSVLRLFDKHVDIMRKPLPMVLSMDEHYFPKSDMDSLYCCLLMNFITGEVIDVLPTRRKHYLIDYFSSIRGDIQNYTLKRSELNNVKYISMDLYDNFRMLHRYVSRMPLFVQTAFM